MAITTCAVTGTLKDSSGTAISGATVEAYSNIPFFHGDGTLISDYSVTTTTASDGTWSLTLVETTSVSRTMTVVFALPTGSVERQRKEYTIIVPATGTATLASLVGTQ